MTELEKAESTWKMYYAAYQATGLVQQCFFTAWIVVLLAVIDAPWWAWVVGLMYAFGHWVHFILHFAANMALADVRKEKEGI